MDTDANTWATAAVRAFLRRTFTTLANSAQRDSLAFRAVLAGLK